MPRRIAASAPGRANLIGHPSDQYGGCTLACSVGLRARVVLDAAAPGRIAAAGEATTVACETDLELRGDALDLARAALLHEGLVSPPFGISYESEAE